MTDSFEFTLDNPLTEEQWDMIADVDFDHTDRIWFHTKHGKEVEFAKVVRCKDCKYYEEQDETIGTCLLTESGAHVNGYCSWAEIKDDIVIIHPEDIVFNSEEDEKAYYEALGAERKEE